MPTVAHIADGFCVDCIEGDGVNYRDGDWVAIPGVGTRTVLLLGVLLVELVMLFPAWCGMIGGAPGCRAGPLGT